MALGVASTSSLTMMRRTDDGAMMRLPFKSHALFLKRCPLTLPLTIMADWWALRLGSKQSPTEIGSATDYPECGTSQRQPR